MASPHPIPAGRAGDEGPFSYGLSSQPGPSTSLPSRSSLHPTDGPPPNVRRLSSHEQGGLLRPGSASSQRSANGVSGAGPSGSAPRVPSPVHPSAGLHAQSSQHELNQQPTHPSHYPAQQFAPVQHRQSSQQPPSNQGRPSSASTRPPPPSGQRPALSSAQDGSQRMPLSSQHPQHPYHSSHDSHHAYFPEHVAYGPPSTHTRPAPPGAHHPSHPAHLAASSSSSALHTHSSHPQYLNYSNSYPPPPPSHHAPPPYHDYAPPPSTSYPLPRLPQTKTAPAPAAKVKKPSAAALKKAAAKAGPPPVQLEYRLVNGVRMVVGKEGRLFDPNPAPGCGTVDFECCFCDKVYQGKHARSIWRRHLCDKHGIPLSDQPRRTRWDKNDTRPKTDEERRERSLESKRKWATKRRAAKRAARTGSQVVSGDEDDDEDDLGSELEDAEDSPAEESPISVAPKKKAPVKAPAKKKAAPAKAAAAAPKGKGKAPARASSRAKKAVSSEPAAEEQDGEELTVQLAGQAVDYESEDEGPPDHSRSSSGASSAVFSLHESHSRATSSGSTQSQALYSSRPLYDYQPQTYAQPYDGRPSQSGFPRQPYLHGEAYPNQQAYARPAHQSTAYHPTTHYPPAPAVPNHFQVPRRPLSAFGSVSSATPATTMTMPGFSPQRRASVPPPRIVDLMPATPSQPTRLPVEDDGAAAILMALRADGSSPVKPAGQDDEGSVLFSDSEEDGEAVEMEESVETEKVSPFVKPEVDDEALKEMERRKLERQTLFPIAPKPVINRRSRQPSFNAGSTRAGSSEATIAPAVLGSALSPRSLPNSSPVKVAAESSPPLDGSAFLQSSSPASPAINGRSPLSTNRTETIHSSPMTSSIRFTSREMPAPTRSAAKGAVGTPTPLARLAGSSTSNSRPVISGLRWGEDARKRMSVAEGKTRESRSSLGTTPSRWGSSRRASEENEDDTHSTYDDENDDPHNGVVGADSRSASEQRADQSPDEDELDEDDPVDDNDSVKPFGSSPLGLSPTKPSHAPSRPALEPLFPPPQVPHHRRPSSTPALLSANGAGGNATLLPIFHPTPFKPTNISSTRTPFKSSSSSHSSHNPSSSSTPNASSQARYGAPASSSRTHTSTLLGSSPPASSFFQLSSPQSLSLTRSLGLAPATPGNVWGGGGAGGETPEMMGGRKRKGSWVDGGAGGGMGTAKRAKVRDSGFFDGGLEEEEGKREVE